jgi:predicted nucleic acid-binding Zn ribbon protein
VTEPTRVRDLLAQVPGLTARLREAGLVRVWPEIAGPGAARSRAEGLEAGVLQVSVDSSGWLHRLTLEAPRLLAACHAIAPEVPVHAIRFQLAPSAPGSSSDAGRGTPSVEGEASP